MILGSSTVTEIGDTLRISKILDLGNINSFSTFTDTVTGENAPTDEFKRQFRYSFDGVNYTDFINTTNANLLLIDTGLSNTIYFDFLYTVISIEPGHSMVFGDLVLNGNITVSINSNFSITKNSVYRKIYRDNVSLLYLTDNLLRKLYYDGVLPLYLDRNESADDNSADKNFIALSRANAEFFGLNSILAQQFENLFSVFYLLFEYLLEKGIEVSSVQSLEDLQYLIKNYYDEVRKRGGIQSFLKKDWHIPVKQANGSWSIVQPVDGELLRMIGFQDGLDEFIFHLFKNSEIGWWIDNSSPLYKGNTQIDSQINKSLLDKKDIESRDDFNLNEGSFTLTGDTYIIDENKKVLKLTNGSLELSNTITDSISYEFTFFVKIIGEGDITISMESKDVNGNTLELKDAGGNIANGGQFVSFLTLPSGNNYYFIRCILFGKNSTNIAATLNIGEGVNLIMSEGSLKANWKIETSGEARFWNIKIKPLSKPYETGFVQPANWFEFWMGNKNGKYNLMQIKNYVRRYLIPYNATLSTIDFAPVISNVTGVEAIISMNTARMFGNLTMFGADYIDPVNGKVQVIDITIEPND